jgi:hypothetical protein
MADADRIYEAPLDVNRRLMQLGGLTSGLLLEAARRGFGAFAACTPHHPRNFPGLAAWAETIRALGDLLVPAPFNWARIEDTGQPLVLSPTGAIAITVAGADENTGRAQGADPRTTSSKGSPTIRAISQNRYLFPELEEDALQRLQKREKRSTWFLLIHRDVVAGEMRCELSKPIAMGEDRHIIGWSERIILDRTDFDSSLVAGIPNGDNEPTAEIIVEIKRRA